METVFPLENYITRTWTEMDTKIEWSGREVSYMKEISREKRPRDYIFLRNDSHRMNQETKVIDPDKM